MSEEKVEGRVVSADCTAPKKGYGFLFYANGVEILRVPTEDQNVEVKLTLPSSGVFEVQCHHISTESSDLGRVTSYEVRLRRSIWKLVLPWIRTHKWIVRMWRSSWLT